jgi:hypothetical protein
VAQPGGEEGPEAVEVAGDLAGDLGGAGAAHGQGEVALGPDGEAVVGRAGPLQADAHLS